MDLMVDILRLSLVNFSVLEFCLNNGKMNLSGPCEKGTYHKGDQRRLRRAYVSMQSRQSFRCSFT